MFLSRTVGHVHVLVRGAGLAATMSDYLVRRIIEVEESFIFAGLKGQHD